MPREHLPLDLLRQVDPADVDRYARASGWRRVNGFDERRMTVYERPDLELRQLLVPARQVDDYELAVADVVEKLAEIEQRSGREILDELLLPPADVLHLALLGPDAERGVVSFSDADDMIRGARQALQAAACTVLRPRDYHARLRLPETEQLLDACRVLSPESGGYNLAVACPLDAVPGVVDGEPFARRTTALLMQSLVHLAESIDAGHGEALLTSPDVKLFSGNLCEALLLMRSAGSPSGLSVCMSWSRSGPLPPMSSGTRVRLGQEHFAVIEQLAARLRSRAGASREFFVGFVEVLRGVPGEDGRPAGEVVVSILRDDEAVRARLSLDAEDYVMAAQAHLEHKPVRFEGVLHRSWRIHRIEAVSAFARVERAAVASVG
jgi:hypothetical protein